MTLGIPSSGPHDVFLQITKSELVLPVGSLALHATTDPISTTTEAKPIDFMGDLLIFTPSCRQATHHGSKKISEPPQAARGHVLIE